MPRAGPGPGPQASWSEGSLVCGALHPVALESRVRVGRPGSWGHGFSVPLLAELLLPPPSSSFSFLPSSQVVFPPGSPVPLRRTFSVLPSPPVPSLERHKEAAASSPPPSPNLPAPSTLGPSVLPCGSPGVQSAGAGPQEDVQGSTSPLPAAPTVRSVGCQTDEDPMFPPMQAGPGPQHEPHCPPPHTHTWSLVHKPSRTVSFLETWP